MCLNWKEQNDAIGRMTGWDYIWGWEDSDLHLNASVICWNNNHIYTETCGSACLLSHCWVWCVLRLCVLSDLALSSSLSHSYLQKTGKPALYLSVHNSPLKATKPQQFHRNQLTHLQQEDEIISWDASPAKVKAIQALWALANLYQTDALAENEGEKNSFHGRC